MSGGPTPNDFRAKVFEDRGVPANWRVEKMDEAGGYEVVKVSPDRTHEELSLRSQRTWPALASDGTKRLRLRQGKHPRPH
jgi:hypothetical protein